MDYPYQFGALQLVLGCVAFIALYVLLNAFKRAKFTDGLFSLIVCALAMAVLYATLMIQAYAGLNADILVARIHASTVANAANEMSVEVVLYDQGGHALTDKTYLVAGNEWMLQGDIVKVSGLLAMAGLHSGYKLTRLEGRFDDASMEATSKHTVVVLNGGDDQFFTAAHALNSLIAPFIDAEYGNAVIDGAGTYNIYVSQSGLWAKGV